MRGLGAAAAARATAAAAAGAWVGSGAAAAAAGLRRSASQGHQDAARQTTKSCMRHEGGRK